MAWLAGALNLMGGRRDNYFNKEEADKARDWSKDMSSTEVQRRVADMRKAGINPMLAASAGASTPGATAAAPSTSGRDLGEVVTGAYFSAQQMKMMKEKNAADVAQVEANTAKTAMETKLLEAQLPYSAANAQMAMERMEGDLKEQMYRIGLRRAEAFLKSREYDELQPLAIAYQRMINQGEAFGLSEKEATSKFFNEIGEGSKWMELVRNLLMGIRSVR